MDEDTVKVHVNGVEVTGWNPSEYDCSECGVCREDLFEHDNVVMLMTNLYLEAVDYDDEGNPHLSWQHEGDKYAFVICLSCAQKLGIPMMPIKNDDDNNQDDDKEDEGDDVDEKDRLG